MVIPLYMLDTDDQIDIKIAGTGINFRFTANNFNVLSGSTLTIDSGATITNMVHATGFDYPQETNSVINVICKLDKDYK